MRLKEKALEFHKSAHGKVGTHLKQPIENKDILGLAYTPGVAEPCKEIHQDKSLAYDYTWKGEVVAVISDGTAVLGLGDIGPEASLPVMEGKCNLLKSFGKVDAVPIVLDTKDPKEIIQIVKAIAPTFGGINLEDISAPRCVEIERALKEELDIPVFHDDQHGTAIVVAAGIINALKLVNKKAEDCTAVITGTGAAGNSIIRMLNLMGVKEIYGFNSKGIILREDAEKYNFLDKELMELSNYGNKRLTIEEAMKEADIYIGVSVPGVINKDMVASMKENPIVFALANPVPEISYDDAIEAGAAVAGTGRSDKPNQINNILAFPGLFKGALACRATKITEDMKYAAAKGIASLISDDELSAEYVVPEAFDERVADVVAETVIEIARKEGIARK